MDSLKQAHFFSLPTQGNVYTIANLNLVNNTNKLLIASLKRQVYSFEYLENSAGILVPTTKEISFTYIPSGADIISIDAFNKSDDRNDFVIGITIIKHSIDSAALESYLNIYYECEESKEFNIESIAQNCLHVVLNFTPYQLTHASLVSWDNEELISKEIVFILTGSDNLIHIIKENTANHTYREIDGKELFPEFSKPPSVVMWVDVHYYNNYSERISAFGCECGYVRLVRVCCKTNTILFNFSTQFISMITQVKLFQDKKELIKPNFLNGDENKNDDKIIINLVVVNAVLPAVFFKDILKNGLKKFVSLRRMEMVSVSTCMAIADINFDGVNEILVGNSAENIILYEILEDSSKLLEIKKLVSPIYNLCYIDITGDGVKELIVFTMKGLYILQHEPAYIKKILEEKVAKLSIPDIQEMES